ncbi:MAG: cupin domain-containing protein [Pseudomonadota bacterium]
MNVKNIFSEIPEGTGEEWFEELVRTGHFRLERIVSRGHRTPEGAWFDQDGAEWVMVLKGRAGLLLEGEKDVVVLNPGDYLQIPAHKKHRVEWTEPEDKTVWLAVHY